MNQIKFVEDSLYKVWKDKVCLSRPHHIKFFKGCLSQILLFQFLNTLTHKHCKQPTSSTAAFSFFKLLVTTNARVPLCFTCFHSLHSRRKIFLFWQIWQFFSGEFLTWMNVRHWRKFGAQEKSKIGTLKKLPFCSETFISRSIYPSSLYLLCGISYLCFLFDYYCNSQSTRRHILIDRVDMQELK